MSGQNHADYRQAEGYLREAISAGYADASEKLLECQYQMALLADQESDFASAYEGFKALGDYGDSQERVAAYDAAYAAAGQLYQNGQYAEAVAAFEALGNLLDSANNGKIAWYAQAEALLAQGKYDAASGAFARAGDYKDASSAFWSLTMFRPRRCLHRVNMTPQAKRLRVRGIIRTRSPGFWNLTMFRLKRCLHRANMTRPAEAFQRAADHEQAAVLVLSPHYTRRRKNCKTTVNILKQHRCLSKPELMKTQPRGRINACIAYADSLLAEGQYDAARTQFSALANYADAADRISEAYYLKGKEWLTDNQFEKARESFEKANGYGDASERIKEAYYRQAESFLQSRPL